MDWKKTGDFFWTDIHDEKSARDAAKLGWYCALFMVGSTLFFILVGDLPILYYVDIVSYCLIGYGCLKMFRVASIVGLILVFGEMYYKYIAHGTLGLTPLFALCYVNAIRGTFYFAKLKKNALEKQ